MTAITIYALFGDDIRILIVGPNGDVYFYVLSLISLIAFTIEVTVSCVVKEGYNLGFFFWLDVISTASLIFDIGWFTEIMFSTGGSASAAGGASIARAARASRVGTKAGRIVRVVRLIRLVKLYKQA